MTRRIRLALLPLALLAAASTASAFEKVTIEKTIPYADANVGFPKLREQCDWNTKLSRRIVAAADGHVRIAKGPLSEETGPVLVLTVTNLHIRGGGVYTGDKSVSIAGELRRGDQVLDTFEVRRATEGSMSICGAANAVGALLAGDIAARVRQVQARLDAPAAKPAQ